MSALFDLHATNEPEFATTPNVTAMPRTMGERYSAEYAASQADDTYWNVQKARALRAGKIIDDIHTLSGERLKNPFDNAATMDEIRENHGQPYPLIFQKRLDKLKEKSRELRSSMPEGGYGTEPGFLDPDMIDTDIAVQSRGVREAAARLEGTGGGLGAFAGGAVGGTLTPHGIASMFIPATRAPIWLSEQAVGGALRNIGREAAYQALTQGGAQAVGSTLDYGSRSQFGTEQTAGEFAGEVLGASVVGGILGGVARGTVPAWLAVRRLWGAGEYVTTAAKDAAITLEGKALYGGKNPLGVPATVNESAIDKAVIDAALNRPADVGGIIPPTTAAAAAPSPAAVATPAPAAAAPTPAAAAPSPLQGVTQAVSDLGSTADVAARFRADPEGTYAKLEAVREQVRAMEQELAKKYGVPVRRLYEVEDRVTPEEAQFLFHGDAPTSTEQLDNIIKQLSGVSNLPEAAREIRFTLKDLPDDLTKLSPDNELTLMRLQVLGDEVGRLGGDARAVMEDAFRQYAARFGDPNDAADMLAVALQQLKALHEAGFQMQAPKPDPELLRLEKLADDLEQAPPAPAQQRPVAPAPEARPVDKAPGESPEDKATLDQAKQLIESPDFAVPPEKRAAYNDALKQEQEARVAAGCLGGGAI